MKIVQLVYASAMAKAMSMEEIVAILDVARRSNAARGITGVMAFRNERFLQLLEGPPAAVNQLYATLMRDPRHVNLALLGYGEVSRRRFPDWSMGFLMPNETAPMSFDPHALSLDEALEHLRGTAGAY